MWIKSFNLIKMLFSVTGEIGMIVIGLLYVANKWFDSFIDILELIKNNDNEEKEKEIPESLKHIYS